MNKINRTLKALTKPALNIYFTAGFPQLQHTVPIIESLASNGVDLIEIGMPYSDPMADGPTIQQSSSVALRNGMTLDLLFEQVSEAGKKVDVPLLLMGYLNQMMQYGEENFLRKCKQVGISGLIIPDLPPELYEEQYRELFEQQEVQIIFLITPQTSEERVRKIDSLSNSFIYVVSDSSITGQTKNISTAQIEYFQRIQKMNLHNPTLIGFGISNHESFMQASKYAAGAIIGSAFIKQISGITSEAELDGRIRQFVTGIKSGE